MNCEQAAALLNADIDGELDPLRADALRRHIAGCPGCRTQQAQALALRQQLRAELPSWRAPDALRARVRALPPPEGPARVPSAGRWRWFGAGALAGGVAVAAAWLALALPRAEHEDLSAAVVSLHTRATLEQRLVAVASIDRHRVRPWLSARLDYAPPVVEAPATGVVLAGARIDRLAGRSVAVLVYRLRDHLVDVVARPADAGCSAGPLATVRGFNVAVGCGAQMQWLAVSDLNATELAALVQALTREVASAG